MSGHKNLIERQRDGEEARVVNARHGVDLEREFDKTALPDKVYGKIVHRDYAAHFFRWGWAHRFVDTDTRLLDVGCGKDLALARVLTHQMGSVPKLYVGVDINKLEPFNCKWTNFYGEFNFIHRHEEIRTLFGGEFDLVTCFEVIEHMGKAEGKKLLEAVRSFMNFDSRFLLSTPVYNDKAMAANHIYEWHKDELQQAIEVAGMKVENVYGTFASWTKIKKVCTDQERKLVEELGKFLSNEVLATFLASKYPDASSNCAWVIRRA